MPANLARRSLLGTIAVTCVVCGAALAARQAQPALIQPPLSKAVVIKGKAPVSNEILRVKLPRPQEADLPNGVHLMVLEDHRAPQVTFQLIVRGAGGYDDPPDHAGLAQFTAALMREGTATRTSEQIATELETIAATLNVNAGLSSLDATLSGSCLTEHVGRWLDLAADILLHPAFPQEELARYKLQQRAQLAQLRASPGFLASERFNRVLYGDHPAGRLAPPVESLEKTIRDALVAFHRARYVPDHAILAIAGDITMARARREVEARLGGWRKAGTGAPEVRDPRPIERAGVYLVARPNSVQTNLVVGAPAIDRLSPDYFALTVMNRVIGDGPTGRLFLRLREEKGYTYGAYSNIVAPAFRGHWQAVTEVRTEVTEPATRELLDEIRRIREDPVPPAELLASKRAIVASFALELESPQAVLGHHVTRYRYGLPLDYWDRYPERIMAVTAAEVQAVARTYLEPSRLQVVAVGNADAIAAFLQTLGPLEISDVEGRPIGPR